MSDRRCSDVRARQSRILKLINCKIIFEVFQPMCSQYINVTDGQTDGQTDGRTIYRKITALCVASRGKIAAKMVFNRFLWERKFTGRQLPLQAPCVPAMWCFTCPVVSMRAAVSTVSPNRQ